MNPERIWLRTTGSVLLGGFLLILAGALWGYTWLSRAGRWFLIGGILLGFLPIMAGVAWIAWERVVLRKRGTGKDAA